jgi:hypothetical protein
VGLEELFRCIGINGAAIPTPDNESGDRYGSAESKDLSCGPYIYGVGVIIGTVLLLSLPHKASLCAIYALNFLKSSLPLARDDYGSKNIEGHRCYDHPTKSSFEN